MKMKAYILCAVAVFVAAVSGSDLIARVTITGNTFGEAVAEHFQWALLTPVGILFLFIPFIGAAFICAAANKRGRARSVVTLFCIAMAALLYFYIGGFQASQQALLSQHWTAAALSIGLLPFFVGLPVLFVTAIAAATAALLDPRPIEDGA